MGNAHIEHIIKIAGANVKAVVEIGGNGVTSLILLAETIQGMIIRIDWDAEYWDDGWTGKWHPEKVTVTVL